MLKKGLLPLLLIAAMLLSGCSAAAPVTAQPSPTVPPAAAATVAAPSEAPSLPVLDLTSLQDAYETVYQKVSPSVVHIQVTKTVSVSPQTSQSPFPFFGFPFEQSPRQYHEEAIGSGFVWDTEGHIVTNNHVVSGADTIEVTFADGTTVDAKLVGADPDSDLAVVQVDAPSETLTPIELADSTKAQVGQIVIAIGNPFGLQGTMTAGIISALGRTLPAQSESSASRQRTVYTIPDIIQTDASINPGNSGGPLVDIEGRLIGVTAAIESPSHANAGIGFVIPSIIVKNVVPELIENGYYEHPWMGVSGATLTSDIAEKMGLDRTQHGVLVVDVSPDSPAEEAGLRGSDKVFREGKHEIRLGGDIITEINGQPVRDFEDLTAYLARYTHVNDTITLGILRDGKPQTLTLTLGVRPTRLQSTGASAGSHVWMGIQAIPLSSNLAAALHLDENQQGLLVQRVYQNSPADKAGIRGSYMPMILNGEVVLVGGDVITAMDGKAITSADDLKAALIRHRPGDEVEVEILRDGKPMTLSLTLELAPTK